MSLPSCVIDIKDGIPNAYAFTMRHTVVPAFAKPEGLDSKGHHLKAVVS